MTAEQIRSSITFKTTDGLFGTKGIIGTLRIHHSVTIDPNCQDPTIEEQAKAVIREEILRALFDDQRRSINEALERVLRCTRMDCSPEGGEAIEALLKAAQYQTPEKITQ